MVIDRIDDPRPLVIGPRVRLELEHRIRELERRFKPTHTEVRELSALRKILKAGPQQ
jgi:hypothetical protein